ncbi:MAG: protein-glutamate O-methyltransferase CheR [Nitrospirae bacterium]|nr:protein-glutamate O-methyltransferase CheR [Nitrospirota bacterium]
MRKRAIPSADPGEIDSFLGDVRSLFGIDLFPYRRSSLGRRLFRRIRLAGRSSLAEYLDVLAADPSERGHLSRLLSIPVTEFFRNPELFDRIEKDVLPSLLDGREAREFRAWCPGCASGEEAYSLAVSLERTLPPGYPRKNVRLFATDVDERSIDRARRGWFGADRVRFLPSDTIGTFFHPSGRGYVVDERIRRFIRFGRHDLLKDSPISHLDLLLCRNVLIYFEREQQERVIARLASAVRPGGFIAFGSSEALAFPSSFGLEPFDPALRIYRKNGEWVNG